jgi:DNA replication and repair protein RecF
MRLIQAELERFRNLKQQRLSFHPRCNLVVGRNAQGKTNLLEAIGYLGGLRSFRGAGRRDLIRRGEEWCRVSGEIEAGKVRRELCFTLDQRGRTQAADGRRIPIAEYLDAAPLVSFIPEDVGVVAGGPARRRRLLDRSILELHPEYLAEYRRFHLALRHRNALLRRRGDGVDKELAGWGTALAETGSFVLQRRLALLSALAPRLAELGRELGLAEGLALSYRPSCPLPREEERAALEQALRTGVESGVARERAAGCTLTGPHRDDLVFLHGERDLAREGSQGQKRGAVLVFKLAQAMLMGEVRGRFPLVLLDDVASELDAPRRAALGRLVESFPAQFFITATGDGPSLPAAEGAVFRVAEGGVERLTMEETK